MNYKLDDIPSKDDAYIKAIKDLDDNNVYELLSVSINGENDITITKMPDGFEIWVEKDDKTLWSTDTVLTTDDTTSYIKKYLEKDDEWIKQLTWKRESYTPKETWRRTIPKIVFGITFIYIIKLIIENT